MLELLGSAVFAYLSIAVIYFLVAAGSEWYQYLRFAKVDQKMSINSKEAHIVWAVIALAWGWVLYAYMSDVREYVKNFVKK